MQKFKYNAYAITVKDQNKESNQDNYYLSGHFVPLGEEDEFKSANPLSKSQVFAICGGIEAFEDGRDAALQCVSTLEGLESKLKKLEGRMDATQITKEYLIDFSENLQKKSSYDKEKTGITFAGLVTFEDNFFIANIGDSKIFHVRGSMFTELSSTHVAYEYFPQGQVKKYPTRYLGSEINNFPYITEISNLLPDDIFLLCNDGLYEAVESISILDILMNHQNIEAAGSKLLRHAQKRGSTDNITFMIIKILSDGQVQAK